MNARQDQFSESAGELAWGKDRSSGRPRVDSPAQRPPPVPPAGRGARVGAATGWGRRGREVPHAGPVSGYDNFHNFALANRAGKSKVGVREKREEIGHPLESAFWTRNVWAGRRVFRRYRETSRSPMALRGSVYPATPKEINPCSRSASRLPVPGA